MLEIKDLHVSYGGIQALRGVSLNVPDGKIVTLIGANGAGKSTLMRTISGLVKAQSGSILWNGQELLGKPIDQIVASGIAMSAICAYRWGLPMVFAKKAKSDNIEGGLLQSRIMSYTYKKQVTLIAAKDWLKPEDKILILDDFMARGEAIRGLIDLVKQSGAELVGIGIAVEKGFQHGGDGLRQEGYPIESLAIIDGADENGFVFRDE